MQTTSIPIFNHLSPVWKTVKSIEPEKAELLLADSILGKIAERQSFEYREILVAALHRQYGSEMGKTISSQIDLLKKNNAFTVTTGHQIGLLGGPAFFFYKIITTIRLAEELRRKSPEHFFVPVLWMATEDHDKAEISSVHIFGKELVWETNQEGAVGRFSTDDLPQYIESVEALKGSLPHGDSIMEIFKKAYAPGKTLANATREWVHSFFSDFGLVIIDGDDPELKRLFRQVMEREILHSPTEKIVTDRNAELVKRGLIAQVHPREINLFYLSDNNRKRIVKTVEGFTEYEGPMHWSQESIMAEIGAHPERFSPNVLLRPIYQEIILPNLAYVGGPGELSYWMQLDGVFSHFAVSEPICFPRNSIMLIDQGQQQRISKLSLQVQDLFRSSDELINEFLKENAGSEMDLEEEKKKIEEQFSLIAEKTSGIDTTLKSMVMAELQKTLKSIEQIESRIRKSEKAKHETSLNQIRTLKEKLFPGGNPQERVESLLPHLWKHGKGLLKDIHAQTNPFDLRYHVLFPDSP